MSQTMTQEEERRGNSEENIAAELAEGFALALEAGETNDAATPAEADRDDAVPPEQERTERKEAYAPPQEATPPAPPFPLEEPGGRGTPETATQAVPHARMLEAVPDGIAEELEDLRRINPEAARLALEDSPEGESLRSRLERYGADLAMDKAEYIMDRRERARHEEMRSRQAVEEHNRRFFATLDSRVPDYAAMLRDASRRHELRAYQQELFRWIEGKPYAEGARLMRIAQAGTNAEEVADLLSRFDAERNRSRTPDPGGALAVPGRRGPAVAPTGIGDKDDWDAGFRMALQSDN